MTVIGKKCPRIWQYRINFNVLDFWLAVPILPDYLSQIDDEPVTSLQNSLKYKNLYMHYMSTMFGPTAAFNGTASNNSFAFDVTSDKLWTNNKLNDENSAVGILLAVKALVQLIMTPFVTSLINSFGYRIPTAFGTFMLFAASFSMCNRCSSHSRIKNSFSIRLLFFWCVLSVRCGNKLFSIVGGTCNARCCVGVY